MLHAWQEKDLRGFKSSEQATRYTHTHTLTDVLILVLVQEMSSGELNAERVDAITKGHVFPDSQSDHGRLADEPRLLWQQQHPKLGESLGN